MVYSTRNKIKRKKKTRVIYWQKYLIKQPLIFAAKTKIKVFKVNGKPETNPSSHGQTAKQ